MPGTSSAPRFYNSTVMAERGRRGDCATARRPDRPAALAKARAGLERRFLREADPDGALNPAERAERAAALRRAFFKRLSRRDSPPDRRVRRRGAVPDEAAPTCTGNRRTDGALIALAQILAEIATLRQLPLTRVPVLTSEPTALGTSASPSMTSGTSAGTGLAASHSRRPARERSCVSWQRRRGGSAAVPP